jgi:hypothetical protein
VSIEAPEMANGKALADLPAVRFRAGKGGEIPHEWAAWMLTEWRNSELVNAKPLKFSDQLRRAVTHFMMDGNG